MSSSEESGGEKERDLQIYHLQESVQSKAVKNAQSCTAGPRQAQKVDSVLCIPPLAGSRCETLKASSV